jgi:hypothetical protein
MQYWRKGKHPSLLQEVKGMRSQRKAGWFLLLGLLMFLAICAGTPAGAANPILPHRFYGSVMISDLPAPVGTHITAVVTGGSEDYTTIVSGEYGTGFLVELFKVQPQGDSTIANGAPITFFINGIPAEVFEVGKGPWMASYPFKDGGETNLDLRIAGTQYTITATAGSGGSISPSGSVPVIEGGDKTFTISPNGCHGISDVLVNGISIGAQDEYTFTNVTSNQTIHAEFTAIDLYVTASANTGGAISPSGQVQVECGENQTFTISPSTGYIIDDVEVNDVSVGALSEVIVGPVTENQTIEAFFTPRTYTITASAGANGNISPSGVVPASYGDEVSFTISPDTGYRINTLLVNGNPVTSTPVYTFYDVSDNQTVAVTFIEGPPEYFTLELGDGWNLVSTPFKLAAGHEHLEDIFPPSSLDDIEVILAWDGSKWVLPGYGYELNPLYAVYVKVKGNTTGYLYPANIPPGPLPAHHLDVGWNLIATTPVYTGGGFPPVPVEDALITIYEFQGGLPGYSMVVSPEFNQPGWVYVRDGTESFDILPYKGYWVWMTNPGDLPGFASLPV